MRRSKTVCLDNLVVSFQFGSVSQCACALITHNARATLELLPSNPYTTYFTYLTYLLHSSLDLLLSHCLLDIGVKLQLILSCLNSSLLLSLSLQHVRIVSRHVYLHLLGFTQCFLGSLNLTICHSLSILAECLFNPFRSLLSRHLRVVSSLTTFRVLHHRHRRTVRKGSNRLLTHRCSLFLTHRLSRLSKAQ